MKYMLIMRATDEACAAFKNVDFNEILRRWAGTTTS